MKILHTACARTSPGRIPPACAPRGRWDAGFVAAALLLLAGGSTRAADHAHPPTIYQQVSARVLIENAGGMPSLCRCANGDLLLAHATHWEPIPAGGVVRLRRSSDDGRTWSEPRTIVEPKGAGWSVACWSGLHQFDDGALMFAYSQCYVPTRPGVPASEEDPAKRYDLISPQRRFEVYLVRSRDHGRTWGPPVQLASRLPWCTTMGRPVAARDGSVLVTLVGPEPEGRANVASLLVRTRDSGENWGQPELLAGGPLGFGEATLGVVRGGDIVAMLRDADAGPRRLFRQTVSHDHGKTWEKPWETKLYGKMPDLLTLPSGRLLLAVGSVDCMDGAIAVRSPPGSTYAALFISDDDGRSWRRDVAFASPDPENLVPFDSPVLAALPNERLLAIVFSADRRFANDPLAGWVRGYHYTIHELAPSR